MFSIPDVRYRVSKKHGETFKIYYMLFSDYDRRIYARLYNSIENYQSEVVFEPETSMARIRHIFLRVLADNPILFWVRKDIECYYERGNLVVKMVFIISKERIFELKREITTKVNEIYDECVPGCSSDYELELAVHDYLTKSVKYVDDGCDEQQTMVGPLLKGVGVCEGIAFAFSYIMGVFGIRCTTIYGQLKNSDVGHAWNMVFLEGKGYHVDVTHDLECCTYPGCHAHLNLKDVDYSNRVWESEIKCVSENFNYFKCSMLKCNSERKAKECLQKMVNSHVNSMELQLNEDLDINEVISAIGEECAKLGVTCKHMWIVERRCLFTQTINT